MARNLEVHMDLLHYCTFSLEAVDDAQNVRLDTACGKDNDQQNPVKTDPVMSQQITSDVQRYQ